MKVFSPLAFFSAYGIDVVPKKTGDFVLGRHRFTEFFVEEKVALVDIAEKSGTRILDIIMGYEGTLWSKDTFSAESITRYLEKQLLLRTNSKTIMACSLDDVFNLSRMQVNAGWVVEFLEEYSPEAT